MAFVKTAPLPVLVLTAVLAVPPSTAVLAVPPSQKVYHHMSSQFPDGFAMFQHFGVNTFTQVEHNCFGAPGGRCVNASAFDPSALNTSQWMETAKDLGVREVCLTAHHEGGFALWQTRVRFRGRIGELGQLSLLSMSDLGHASVSWTDIVCG